MRGQCKEVRSVQILQISWQFCLYILDPKQECECVWSSRGKGEGGRMSNSTWGDEIPTRESVDSLCRDGPDTQYMQ